MLAGGPRSQILLRQLGVEPTEISRMEQQISYRVRLTPLPEEVGLSTPEAQWPETDKNSELFDETKARDFEFWCRDYAEDSKSVASAELLAEFGRPYADVASAIEIQILELHDSLAGADSPGRRLG